MKSLLAFLTALTIPIMFLNMLGGLVSGIWLAILREWGAIGTGVILFFVSTGMIGILLMPSMIFMAPATLCAKKGKTLGLIFFGALGNIYTIVVLTAVLWHLVFIYERCHCNQSYSSVNMVLWSGNGTMGLYSLTGKP
jgi:lipoprotein signal peptidase